MHLVTVTARYDTPTGDTDVGEVDFELTAWIRHGDVAIGPAVITAPVVAGELSIELAATRGDDVEVVDEQVARYRVTERLAGARPHTYEIDLDAGVSPVDLADLRGAA